MGGEGGFLAWRRRMIKNDATPSSTTPVPEVASTATLPTVKRASPEESSSTGGGRSNSPGCSGGEGGVAAAVLLKRSHLSHARVQLRVIQRSYRPLQKPASAHCGQSVYWSMQVTGARGVAGSGDAVVGGGVGGVGETLVGGIEGTTDGGGDRGGDGGGGVGEGGGGGNGGQFREARMKTRRWQFPTPYAGAPLSVDVVSVPRLHRPAP